MTGLHRPARVRSGMPVGTGRDRAAWFAMINQRAAALLQPHVATAP
jgi:hypothetical protein